MFSTLLYTTFFTFWAACTVSSRRSPCHESFDLLRLEGKCVCHNAELNTFLPLKSDCHAELSSKSLDCEWSCVPQVSQSRPRAQVAQEPLVLADGTVASCPFQRQACPIFSDDLWTTGSNKSRTVAQDYECVAILRDLDNCGGCVSTGEGTACTSIEGVRGASCVQGKCEITSCSEGYTLTFSIEHGRRGRKHGRNGRAGVKKTCVKRYKHARMTL